MKEYSELCQEAIDGWRETKEKWIPIYCLSGYFYAKLSKKELDKLKKTDREVIEMIEEKIEKGRKIVLEMIKEMICKKCGNKINTSANFCENCGEKISNINDKDENGLSRTNR
jgi:ribosomal protein L40E